MARTTYRTEGERLHIELVAAHTIMRRGADLTVAALGPHGTALRTRAAPIRSAGRWLVTFMTHHHASEDVFLWPLLRDAFPQASYALDTLAAQHDALDADLLRLTGALMALPDGKSNDVLLIDCARRAAEAVRRNVRTHIEAEEPLLAALFPHVAGPEAARVRASIVADAPKGGPDLVLGLLALPEPAPGHDVMLASFPTSMRLLRPLLLRGYLRRIRRLGVQADGISS
ncbi:MAG: hemerythrin domain-containing protein [Polyangiales bacterium]